MDTSKHLLPATKSQKKLIEKLAGDFPAIEDSAAYRNYLTTPDREHASSVIADAMEEHAEQIFDEKSNYVHYLAYRPRAEKVGEHGLFSYYGEPVVLNSVAEEVAAHEGKVWTAVFSLRREDATRLGYDYAARWQELLNANASLLAEKLHIEPTNFKWYAAFHDEGDHPHVHFVAYAAQPGGEYLAKNCVVQIRSALARQIFKDELQQIYEQQTTARNTLTEDAEAQFKELLDALRSGISRNAQVEKLLPVLSEQLKNSKGKKVYGYLPPRAKETVDRIVDALAADEKVAAAFTAWGELRQQVYHTYMDEDQPLAPLSQQAEFKQVRNMVVREVWQMTLHPADDGELPEPVLPDDSMMPEDDRDELQPQSAPKPKNQLQQKNHRAELWTEKFQFGHSLLYKKDSTPAELKNGAQALYEESMNGNDLAMYDLAQFYTRGLWVSKDEAMAAEWYSKARQGFEVLPEDMKWPSIHFRIGKMYMLGLGTEIDVPRAEEELLAAASNGHDYAAYFLGKLQLREAKTKDEVDSAIGWLKQAAHAGNDSAQYLLGRLYLAGEIVAQNRVLAVRYLSDAAQRGNDFAAYKLATVFLDRSSGFYDPAKAIALLEQAAKAKNEYAEYRLGKLLMVGEQVPKDVDRALALLHHAADKKHNLYAQYYLGKTYLLGNDTPQDVEKGKWYLQASASQGNEYAQYLLDHWAEWQTARFLMSTTKLLRQLEQLFQEQQPRERGLHGCILDRKRMRQLREKKIALGHAEGDLELML